MLSSIEERVVNNPTLKRLKILMYVYKVGAGGGELRPPGLAHISLEKPLESIFVGSMHVYISIILPSSMLRIYGAVEIFLKKHFFYKYILA